MNRYFAKARRMPWILVIVAAAILCQTHVQAQDTSSGDRGSYLHHPDQSRQHEERNEYLNQPGRNQQREERNEYLNQPDQNRQRQKRNEYLR